MILEYETGIVKHVAEFDNRIRRVEFSSTFDTDYQIEKFVEYPVCFIERNIDDYTVAPKSIDCETNDGVTKFFLATVTYKLKIWYEKAAMTIAQLQKLRFYFEDNPYVKFIQEGAPYAIGMRFQYISMDEQKNGDNRQGAQRAIVATWQSTIPFSKDEPFVFIESVQINLNKELIIKNC